MKCHFRRGSVPQLNSSVRRLPLKEDVLCTYCDSVGDTKDHVPPKLLFAKPRPELLTVPSCRECNNNASLDDEYFRLMLTLKDDAGKHPEAHAVLPQVLRSLQKPDKKRFSRNFYSSIREAPKFSDGGVYLGEASTYDVDLQRIEKVMQRTTRGLFLKMTGRRLPLSCEVSTYSSTSIARAGPAAARKIESAVAKISSEEEHSLGDGVIWWKYALAPGTLNTSMWVFVFFEAVPFVAWTIDEEERPEGV